MIGKQALEAAGIEHTAEQAAAVERVILAFAVKDIDDLRGRMTHLLGLRLIDAISDPNATASHLNSAMKWLEQTSSQNQPEDDPIAAAIRNARPAMAEGGKLPELDEYMEDQTNA